jgi:hypothetical protein
VKQADTVPSALGNALVAVERQVQRNHKKYQKLLDIPDWQADDLMDMGILLGEVYDEKIIDEMLAQGAESYSG